METVPLKVQESIFDQLLAKADNKVCADCPNKSPTWTSIDFGVFLCLRCAGVHRQLGPSISRVRSAKLDSWKMECIEMLAAVGNRIGNDYWENRVPSHFRKPDITTSMEDVRKMVNEKYIKKTYAPKDRQNPVIEFLEAKKTSQITAGAFSQAKLAEINGGSANVSKPSVSMKVDTQKSTTVVAPPQKQKDLLDFDDDEDENFGSFSSAPAEKLEISSPTKDMHQWNSNHETPTNIGSTSGSHLHHTKNPISHHSSNNMMNLFPADLDFTGTANNANNSTNAPKSSFGFINNSNHHNQSSQQQQQQPQQQQNNTSVNSNQLYDLYKSPNTNQALLTQAANPAKNFSGGQSNYAFLEMMGGQNRGQQQQQQQQQQNQQQQYQQQQQQYQQQQYQQQNNGFGMQNNTQQQLGYGNSNNKQFSANGFGNGFGVPSQGGFSGGVNNTGGFGAPTQQGFGAPTQQGFGAPTQPGFGGQGFGGQNAGFPSNHFGGNSTGMQQPQGGFSMGSNATPGYGGGMPVNNTTTNTSNNFMWEQPKSSSNTMNLF